MGSVSTDTSHPTTTQTQRHQSPPHRHTVQDVTALCNTCAVASWTGDQSCYTGYTVAVCTIIWGWNVSREGVGNVAVVERGDKDTDWGRREESRRGIQWKRTYLTLHSFLYIRTKSIRTLSLKFSQKLK